MPTISVGNSRIHYTVTGEGPALLLVHGVGKGGQVTFGHLLEEFARRNTVILPELSGSETAEDDGTPLTIEQLAEEVGAVIEHAGLGPVDLVGFSLGGAVVAATAALYPERVRRLVPVGGLIKSDLYIQNLIGLTLSQKHDAKAFGRVLSTTAFSPRFIRSQPSLSDVENLGSELSPPAAVSASWSCSSRSTSANWSARYGPRPWSSPRTRTPRCPPSTPASWPPPSRAPRTPRSTAVTW